MWPRGRICSYCALAWKPSGPVGLDSLDIRRGAGGCGKMEGFAIMLGELGVKERRRVCLMSLVFFYLFINSHNFRTTKIKHFAVFIEKNP